MIVASCPLRISLFGGSSDNPYYIEKYGKGGVLSFTCNLKTYVTYHVDKLGYNNTQNKYIINYSKREECDNLSSIQNEVVRHTLKYFNCSPMTLSMTSDIYSQGSGLASSSSYIINIIKCISMIQNVNLTDIEICKLAFDIEKRFNPYCGYQDPYGCGVGGFKRIDFKNNSISYEFLSTDIFNIYDTHLVFTGITRNSKEVLKDVSLNVDKIYPIYETFLEAYDLLKSKYYEDFLRLMRFAWNQKKKTSQQILDSDTLIDLDEKLSNNKSVISHKLCGAGGGGFFLVFSLKNQLNIDNASVKICVDPMGISAKEI